MQNKKVDAMPYVYKALFLFILGVTGGYIHNTLGCQIPKLFSEHPAIKTLFMLILIYFTIHIGDDRTISPLSHLYLSVKVTI